MFRNSKKYLLILILLFASSLYITYKSPNPNSLDFASSTFYVSPSGNDLSPGSVNLPFASINKAISVATAGDTIKVNPGNYRENIKINGKNGIPSAPIRIIGQSKDISQYPVIDGGDASFTSTASNPTISILNSSWLIFERLKLINGTEHAYNFENSHYITVRRNIINMNRHGIRLKNKSSHILVEYNEFFQDFPKTLTWSELKGSKYEGGAFISYGGAGMNIIRKNYFHDLVNAVVLYNQSPSGNYYDANVWIYRNRFENIVDDPFEPESYAFNNHFFQNTLSNTHRMVSLAPGGSAPIQGPIYIYNNLQIVSRDPTLEANSGRANSAFKLDLSANYYRNGVFAFNNSVDISAAGLNGYGVDILSSTVNNFTHLNNAYRTEKQTILKPGLTLSNSLFDYDISQTTLGYPEAHGYQNLEPGFANPANEDFRLNSGANALSKSKEIVFTTGFTSNLIIPAGSDLGAYQLGSSDFRTTPLPKYEIPPLGEDPTFPANLPFPPDNEGGANPPSGPKWTSEGNWTNVTPTRLGDANSDGKVDGIDYVIWLNHYNQNFSGASNGDFNNNGFIDGIDYVIWLNNYGA